MPKNIVICCDGTGNQLETDGLSNVLRLFQVLQKNQNQIVYYDPGIGTISNTDPWASLKSTIVGLWGMLTGSGIDRQVLTAYEFIVDIYEDGDSIYLFGFSRGAYAVRILAGFITLVGLLERSQKNLSSHAFIAYKRGQRATTYTPTNYEAWHFGRVVSARRVPIRFVGVWDTVNSLVVPRSDRLYVPSLDTDLPFTQENWFVEVFRQAIAIDEKRRMFRINMWVEPQRYEFHYPPAEMQDIKQVWFVGFHADVGGGHDNRESGLAKCALQWMIDEAVLHGIARNQQAYNEIVLGEIPARMQGAPGIDAGDRLGPDATAPLHNSMGWGWALLEAFPQRRTRSAWPNRRGLLGLYLPLSEPRYIPEGSRIHHTVLERIRKDPTYRPSNLPSIDRLQIEGRSSSE